MTQSGRNHIALRRRNVYQFKIFTESIPALFLDLGEQTVQLIFGEIAGQLHRQLGIQGRADCFCGQADSVDFGTKCGFGFRRPRQRKICHNIVFRAGEELMQGAADIIRILNRIVIKAFGDLPGFLVYNAHPDR